MDDVSFPIHPGTVRITDLSPQQRIHLADREARHIALKSARVSAAAKHQHIRRIRMVATILVLGLLVMGYSIYRANFS